MVSHHSNLKVTTTEGSARNGATAVIDLTMQYIYLFEKYARFWDLELDFEYCKRGLMGHPNRSLEDY